MEVLLLLIMGAANILCFVIGAKVGQAVFRGEKVELPTINPTEIVKEHQAKKEAEMALDRVNTIAANIDCYDGTEYGQKEVPRG